MKIDFDTFQADLNKLTLEKSQDQEYKLLAARDTLIIAGRHLRTAIIEVEALLIGYMQGNDCDIVISDKERLYVGTTKTTKSIDDQGILMAIMEAGNGNLELLTTGDGGMLASQPWKYGAVRALIGDEAFGKCFSVEVKLDAKTGKPAKQVKVFSKEFAKAQVRKV